MLKEKNVVVYFEDEKINTLTMDGELILVVLSSVAQQEVENISANVKKGLKMRMSRGELIGFNGCLGYDYHAEDKSLTVNEEEAETARYIFNRYIEGAGCFVIARELENLGEKDQFYIRDHHEPIITKKVFEKAHEILNIRAENYKRYERGKLSRNKFTQQYRAVGIWNEDTAVQGSQGATGWERMVTVRII